MPQQHQPKNKDGSGLLLILIVVILIAAGSIRIYKWIIPPTELPLLAQADDMIRIASIDDERLSGTLTTLLPTETFGGTVRVIGLYPNGGLDLPKNSISVVYQREGWRMMQIDLLPQTTIENVLGPFSAYRRETVVLSHERDAQLINIKTLLDCLPSRTKDGIGSCRFTRLMVFEIEPSLIGRLAVDGDKVTDGELIAIARSMVKSIDEVTAN